MALRAPVYIAIGLVVGLAIGYVAGYSWYLPQLGEFEAKNSELMSEVRDLESVLKEKDVKVSQLQDTLQGVQTNMTVKDSQISELQDRVGAKDSQIFDMQDRLGKAESEIQALRLELEEARNAPPQREVEYETILEKLKPYGDVKIVNMIAKQFAFEPHRVSVNMGDVVVLRVLSTLDLDPKWGEHGIMIEGYEINEKLPINQTITIIFLANKAGTFPIHCSVYCGSGHGDMHGQLVVAG